MTDWRAHRRACRTTWKLSTRMGQQQVQGPRAPVAPSPRGLQVAMDPWREHRGLPMRRPPRQSREAAASGARGRPQVRLRSVSGGRPETYCGMGVGSAPCLLQAPFYRPRWDSAAECLSTYVIPRSRCQTCPASRDCSNSSSAAAAPSH